MTEDNDFNFPIADLTFGAGGHSTALAMNDKKIKVIGVDQDKEAFENGLTTIKEASLQDQIELVRLSFGEFPSYYQDKFPEKKLSGALMDLGVSSHHFDSPERGFSFRHEGPLDMRMDQSNNDLPTAEEVLNRYSEQQIADIIFKYGEERLGKKIARHIVERRDQERLETTKQLENIVYHCYPKRDRFKKAHPATRTFQALRLFVNQELEVLESTMEDIVNLLAPGSKFCIISFHSLEDRIAKHQFKDFARRGLGRIETKKPILPSAKELEENPRSRSAKLRVFTKS